MEPPRKRRRLPGHWALWVLGPLVAIVAAVGVYVWTQYRTLTSAKFSTIDYTVPNAPPLVAGSGETVYRIDPTHSTLSYQVEEKLLGQGVHTAKGSTNGIAGDIALNRTNPSASRVGEIVANVEELHSDNRLRDARIRQDYLSSHDFPLASLTVASLRGMPATVADGQTYHFTMATQLTVKKIAKPVTWDVDGSVANGKLTATATAHVKLSTWDVGPINLAGLVSTGDDATLTMKLTALDPSKYTVPNAIAPPASARHSGSSPSFKKVIMPALQANCASCHNSGQVGAAHWVLDDANDAAQVADGIGTVVKARYMPPWPASDLGVALLHSKRLPQKTVDQIVQWADAGGKLDVPGTTRITPTRGPAGAPPRHDVVLTMPQAYAGSLSNPNDYRCFVLDPHITKPTYVTGYEVTPGHREEIHHAQIFHVDAAQVADAAAKDGKDGKPGWSCYAGPSLSSKVRDRTAISPGAVGDRAQAARHSLRGQLQPGLIAGWVPGQDPVIYPDHSGILFQPGDAIVLQIHYHYEDPPVPDRSTVALQLDPGTAPVKRIDIVNPLGPVEIPCMPGQDAPLCNRANALQDDAHLYGPTGSLVEGGLLALCNKTADELAATFHNGIATSSCDTRVPESGNIVGAMGHMHTLGKSFRLTLDPGTPQQKVLLDIPTWNFDWQMNYQFQTPLHVNAGETVRMECTWDRSLDPNRAPKYIVFAEGTEDEMCFSTYALIPDDQSQTQG